MASLKFSSSIEHVCLHEWNLSTLWLDAGFNTWTLTDTILFAMFALLCVCYQTITSSSPKMDFVLPYLLPFFSPLISILFYSFPCFSILIVMESSMQFSQETLFLTGTMKYHKALPSLMRMHPQEMHPEHIRKPTGMGYDLRFQQ